MAGGVTQGSIPACAGETRCQLAVSYFRRVYPRVCGGNLSIRLPTGSRPGLSPRVRGKREYIDPLTAVMGSIPACAGETQGADALRVGQMVYPRVCGGNDRDLFIDEWGDGLSPRVRGKPPAHTQRQAGEGSIPACAGETAAAMSISPSPKVYPRVCGGNLALPTRITVPGGLSPRVRGKLLPAGAL